MSKAQESGSIFTRFYSQLHTSELNDGYDWGRLNLQSVTEQSSLDDFLATAELAGTEFAAGKLLLSASDTSHGSVFADQIDTNKSIWECFVGPTKLISELSLTQRQISQKVQMSYIECARVLKFSSKKTLQIIYHHIEFKKLSLSQEKNQSTLQWTIPAFSRMFSDTIVRNKVLGLLLLLRQFELYFKACVNTLQ